MYGRTALMGPPKGKPLTFIISPGALVGAQIQACNMSAQGVFIHKNVFLGYTYHPVMCLVVHGIMKNHFPSLSCQIIRSGGKVRKS